jgi:hypothetical protein
MDYPTTIDRELNEIAGRLQEDVPWDERSVLYDREKDCSPASRTTSDLRWTVDVRRPCARSRTR